jgi:type I restriction enzyme S subunit
MTATPRRTAVQFGEVVRNCSETVTNPAAEGLTRLVALEHLEPGVPYLRRWSEIDDATSFRRLFRDGQVLFSKRRVYQRKAARAQFDGVCSGDILVFEADESRLLPALLPFLVHTDAFMGFAEQTSAGSLSPRTRWKDLAKFPLVLPSLAAQQEIVAVLDASLRDWLANEEAVAAARVAKAAMANAYFEDEIAAGPTTRLGEAIASAQYGLSIKGSVDGDVPILGMAQMVDGRMALDGASSVSIPASDLKTFRLQPNDILFNRTNSVEHVGRVALNELDEDFVFASYLIRLRAKEDVVLPRFLFEFLASRAGQKRVRRFISRGVSQANINATNLKTVLVPTPAMSRQEQFLERVAAADDLVAHLRTRLDASRAVLSALIERELSLTT